MAALAPAAPTRAAPAATSGGHTLNEGHDIVEIKGHGDGARPVAGRFRRRSPAHRGVAVGMYMVEFGAGESPMYVESLCGRERIVRHLGRRNSLPPIQAAARRSEAARRIVGVFRRL
jgi:hypothetical protein